MTLCTWVTFEHPTHDDGEPVSRAGALAAATAELAELAAADPRITGATLVLDDGERIILDPTAVGGRA